MITPGSVVFLGSGRQNRVAMTGAHELFDALGVSSYSTATMQYDLPRAERIRMDRLRDTDPAAYLRAVEQHIGSLIADSTAVVVFNEHTASEENQPNHTGDGAVAPLFAAQLCGVPVFSAGPPEIRTGGQTFFARQLHGSFDPVLDYVQGQATLTQVEEFLADASRAAIR